MASNNACVVDNCCFCGDLRTGSFAIGYVNLVWSLVVSAIYGLTLAAVITLGYGGITAVMSIVLAISLLRVIFVIVFLVGLHQYQARLVLSYLVFSAVFIVLAIILFITQIFLITTILDIIFSVFDILLNIYFLVVIRSYYFVMIQPANPPMMFQPTVVNMQPQFVGQQQPQYVGQPQPQFVVQQQPQYVGQPQPQLVGQQQPQYVGQPQPQYVAEQQPQYGVPQHFAK